MENVGKALHSYLLNGCHAEFTSLADMLHLHCSVLIHV